MTPVVPTSTTSPTRARDGDDVVASATPADLPTAWFDWLTWPALVAAGLVATAALLTRMSPTAVTVVVTTALVVVLLGLERLRPQRPRAARTEPLLGEIGHVLVGTELGSVLGYGGAVALGEALARLEVGVAVWPTSWPLLAQVGLGLLIADLGSYAQHRAVHRIGWLWPFHALHHQPRALDLIKTGRFHIVDITTNAFVAYLPLALLGASPVALAWIVIVNGIGGLLQHANVRLPTPAWLDALVCTPAVHWRHHSRALADDGDFATMCMLIDRALGTWAPTHGRRPAALGLEQDPLPRGWLASLLAPLAPRRLVR